MSVPGPRSLPQKAADTTAEQPWPVRVLSMKIEDYVAKMSAVWIEGQVVQHNDRGAGTVYLTLRDTDVDMSLPVSMPRVAMDRLGAVLQAGSRVVVHVKPSFWTKRGSLQLEGRAIRAVGVGELLARVEELKRMLAAEGLFDARRKRPLPFLPRRIGLICGRDSAAEHDVVANATRRWPAARFEIRRVAVQGTGAVPAVVDALTQLDLIPDIDVIVIARGGGSVEDLLPFSNEALVRAVAGARTPVVSAIGHHQDTPLVDYVADLRASTPTDAAKQIVPDLAAEHAAITAARSRMAAAVTRRVNGERTAIAALLRRPVMARPAVILDGYRDRLAALQLRSRHVLLAETGRRGRDLATLVGQLRGLSPLSTLERGYAVVQDVEGTIITDQAVLSPDDLLRVRVARGDFAVRVVGSKGRRAKAG